MIVVIDFIMMDMVKLCDYVLLIVIVFEEEDIYYFSMYYYYVQYGKKFVELQGEVKLDSWIWLEFVKCFGFGELFEYSIEEFLEMGFFLLEVEDVMFE